MILRAGAVLPRRFFSFIRSVAFSNKMCTSSGPLCLKFVPVEKSEITSISKPEGFKFRILSYNILAQVYVKSAVFPHSPSSCLKWKARSRSVLTVLESLEVDFLCLQELDEYDSFYKGNLERHEYSSIYIQRSGQKRDGCGIFYKRNSAELVMQEKIDYNDLVHSILDEPTASIDKNKELLAVRNEDAEMKAGPKNTSEGCADPNDPCVRLKRDCVGIMAAFKLNDSSHRVVIIANTHLYWDPEWADVKLAQAKYLLSRLAIFKSLVSDKCDCTPSIIVSGDFNSVPGDQVYQYLVSGTSSLGPSEEDAPMPLVSVYATTRGEPQFTNCTPDFTGTLDYIFFSSNGDVKPVSYLQLPDSESSEVNGGLPNFHHPSDHLPIGAEFELIH